MRRSRFFHVITGLMACVAVSAANTLHAQMEVLLGEVVPITGPTDLETLRFPENIVYAIDVWGAEDREVLGTTFKGDRAIPATGGQIDEIPGYRTDMTHNVDMWETKPEFGDTVDDDEFEEMMHSIRWTDNSAGDPDIGVGVHFEVLPNAPYTLELLISGNHMEDRKWDILVEEELAVDEMDSNADQPYDQGISYAFRYAFTAPDEELNITFRQGTTGGDGNAILHAAILARAGEPVTPGDFNSDGNIDLADFAIMVENFNGTGKSFAEGDNNFNRRVDLEDFIQFRDLFAGANPGGGGQAVPEPGSPAALLLGGTLATLFRRSRRKRR